MSNNGSYSHDRSHSGDGDAFGADPASGGFFTSDYKKHDDLKQMLDSNKDSLKLEAMKRIIGMVAKGRDASELFPAVVKNVVSKNIEVKKLVYVYLVRYAEEQQDLALLSISTFQRALKDPNQLIRASALRILSSIRVTVIVPIVMLAIKDSASDMSPYVRKTAAHAIPKIYSLDPEQKEELVHLIQKLLSDKTTLVVGSAVMAFEEVCPERIDLIHQNYRKLCALLVDVDEWGQVIIINMLIRYARTQFVDPNVNDGGLEPEDKPFYGDEDEDEKKSNEKVFTFDPDYRLLLRSTKPLLQSRNASVVMAVASLYHHVAPKSEVSIVAKALIRLLRSHREVQSVVLNCIASISTQRKNMFEPYLKSFFVRTSDPTHLKLLKLEIMTNLATEANIPVILREFQTYIASHDKEFVAATIEAIGRCASNIKEVNETCLNGLVALLSNRDQAVVAESVVMVKKLLQTEPDEHKDIVVHLAKLVENVTVPQARASILWLLGEYSDRVPKIAPDVLRKMAKVFINQEDLVKLQIMNLAVKLFLTNPAQTKLLCQYVFNLAKYDQNYDIRDRARFMRNLIFPTGDGNNGSTNKFASYAKKIFLASKPPPVLESKFKDRDQFQLGSLSHYINSRSVGYFDLPVFPDIAPDASARNVSVTEHDMDTNTSFSSATAGRNMWMQDHDTDSRFGEKRRKRKEKERPFYSESDESSEDEDINHSTSSGTSGSDATSSEEETSDDEEKSSDDSDESAQKSKRSKKVDKSREKDSTTASESSEEESSEEATSSDEEPKKETTQNQPSATETAVSANRSNLDLLLELDDIPPSIGTPILTPSLGGILTPMGPAISDTTSSNAEVPVTSYVPTKTTELASRYTTNGLQITGRYTRSPHLYSPSMISIELVFTNHSEEDISDIKVGNKALSPGMSMHEFAVIGRLAPHATLSGTLGIDFADSCTQAAAFDVVAVNGRCHRISLKAPVGELLRPIMMPEAGFLKEQSLLRGMNETSVTVSLPSSITADEATICRRVYEVANVARVCNADIAVFRFSSQTVSAKTLVLLTLKFTNDNSDVVITVNCDKMVLGSMLANELKGNFSRA